MREPAIPARSPPRSPRVADEQALSRPVAGCGRVARACFDRALDRGFTPTGIATAKEPGRKSVTVDHDLVARSEMPCRAGDRGPRTDSARPHKTTTDVPRQKNHRSLQILEPEPPDYEGWQAPPCRHGLAHGTAKGDLPGSSQHGDSSHSPRSLGAVQ
jgi:hypothetical protein